MKRISKAISLILAVLTLFALSACGDSYQDAIIYFELATPCSLWCRPWKHRHATAASLQSTLKETRCASTSC